MKKLFLTTLFLVCITFSVHANDVNGDTEFNQLNFYYNNGSTPVPQTISNIFYNQGENPLDDYYFNLAYYLEDGTYTETKLSTNPEDASMSLGFYITIEESNLSLVYDGESFTSYKPDEEFPDYNVAEATIIARPNVIGEEPVVSMVSAGIYVYEGDLPTAENLTGLSFGPRSPEWSGHTLVLDGTSSGMIFTYPPVDGPEGIYWSLDGGDYFISPLYNVALNQGIINIVSSDQSVFPIINKLGGYVTGSHGKSTVTITSPLNDVSSYDAPEGQVNYIEIDYTEPEHDQSDVIEVTTNPSDLVIDYNPASEENVLPVSVSFSPAEAVPIDKVFFTTGNLDIASVESYQSNLNFEIYANSPGQTELIINYAYYNSQDELVYTSKEIPITVNTAEIIPDQIITNRDTVFLTTKSNYGYSEANVTASFIPSTFQGSATWTSRNPSVATVSSQTGNDITIQAKSPGFTIVEAYYYITSTERIVDYVNVYVNDSDLILDDIVVTAASPDFYQVTAKNVRVNPAYYDQNQSPISQVEMFTWSAPDQSDLDCKIAGRIGSDWTYTFPVNNNEVNNFYIDADKIKINVYGSNVPGSNGNFLGATTYKAVNQMTAGDNPVAYISYAQDQGFEKPTVFNGEIAGSTGQNIPLEGLRISSNVEGVGIQAAVHVQDYGWQSPVPDGTYAGTMFENKQIEALQLTLTGPNQYAYQLSYRVHVEDIGWTDWVLPRWFNQFEMWAGTVGQNKQIEAIQVVLLPR